MYTCVITVIITFALVFTFTGMNVPLTALIDDKYDSHIHDYHIIDCGNVERKCGGVDRYEELGNRGNLAGTRFVLGIYLAVESFIDVPRIPNKVELVLKSGWLITLAFGMGALIYVAIAVS